MDTYDYLVDKINSLKAAIETETIKIKTLGTYYSYLQVRAWRKYRASLNDQLKYYRDKLEVQKQALQK